MYQDIDELERYAQTLSQGARGDGVSPAMQDALEAGASAIWRLIVMEAAKQAAEAAENSRAFDVEEAQIRILRQSLLAFLVSVSPKGGK